MPLISYTHQQKYLYYFNILEISLLSNTLPQAGALISITPACYKRIEKLFRDKTLVKLSAC